MCWRVQIQANDVGRLNLEVRIVRGHVAIQPVGLEAVLGPHARHHHVRNPQLRRQAACAPMCRTIGGCVCALPAVPALPASPSHDSPAARNGGYTIRPGAPQQSVSTNVQYSCHRNRSPRESPTNVRHGQHQDAARSSGVVCTSTLRSHTSLQFFAFRHRHLDSHRSTSLCNDDHTSISDVTAH